MWAGPIYVLILMLFVVITEEKQKERPKTAEDILKNEAERLKVEKKFCRLKQVSYKTVNSHRISQQSESLAACFIQLLQTSPKDGWLWSILGHLYLLQGEQFSTTANTCFKQASKHSGKISPYIRDWYFLGPFVIGKTELDGDPLEFYGGIKNVSRFRTLQSYSVYSELVSHGKVQWKQLKTNADELIKISPDVNWNDLVSSLGSMGITEWQGWVVGEFAVNDKDVQVLIQCLGVHTIFVDDQVLTGDVYHRGKFWFSVSLESGIHTIRIRLRAKIVQNLKCSLKIADSDFAILSPPFLPDLVDGYLPSFFIAIPVSNYGSKWLKDIRVTVTDLSENVLVNLKLHLVEDSKLALAPGQTRPINIELIPSEQPLVEGCQEISFTLRIRTSEGQQTLPITLRCRKASESFLFTFLDHDGSVQHAAAIQPSGGCTQTNRQTDRPLCPIMLTLHGTTVPPQNQADSYKHMVDGKFIFGVPGAWVLAPTRHGAHNWEGPGALTAMTSLTRLAEITNRYDTMTEWMQYKASNEMVIFAGHSMGGHGAWHLATHFPDLAIAVISLAGWIKKEEYGDSNLFFKHDISTSHTDPAIKSVLEASIAENDADRFVANLKDIPVLVRIGADDRTVHPFFTRRMYRRLKEEGVNVTYTELKDKQHWWWDTRETNDGGAVNDQELREFVRRVTEDSVRQVTQSKGHNSCVDDDCNEDYEHNKYSSESNLPHFDDFTYSTMNPAFGGSMRGIQILEQITPFRLSKIKGRCINGEIRLETTNVAKFSIQEPNTRPIQWRERSIILDGQVLLDLFNSERFIFCKSKETNMWDVCARGYELHYMGPARRIAESKLIIVTGTGGTESRTSKLQNEAVYIANLFYLTSDAFVSIITDREARELSLDHFNIIVLGNQQENSLTQDYMSKSAVKIHSAWLHLGNCYFDHPQTGLMTLTSNGDLHLAMILMGLTPEAMEDVITLATPTIPPMTRSPFSNLLPEFVITGPEFRAKGPGGYLCAGFWGNNWEYRPELASCVC